MAGGWHDIPKSLTLHFTAYKRERQALKSISSIIRNHSKRGIKFTFSSNTGINGILGILRFHKILKTELLIVRESTQLLDRFGGLKGFIFRKLYKWGYPMSDLVICQTNYMKERLLVQMPRAKEWNLQVIPNPTNAIEVVSMAEDVIEYKKYGKYIVGVGRFIELKGFDLLIEAMLNLDESINLVLVGSGEKEEELMQKAKKLKISHRIFFTGYQNNPYPYMKHAHICMISSTLEGFPNTLLQMMAVNTRVVSTLCAGDIDSLKGLITVPIGSSAHLVDGIRKALSLSNDILVQNRIDFDQELKRRTPENFMNQILACIIND